MNTEKTAVTGGGNAPRMSDEQFNFAAFLAALTRGALTEECMKYKSRCGELLRALERARQDLIAIKEDCNSGEFEIDPQFAIDKIQDAISRLQEGK